MTDDDSQGEVRKVGPPASDRGVYGISVAAELSGISEQSLRLYERQGLLTPGGVNLAGIDRILSLEDRNAALDERNVTLEGDNDALRAEESRRKAAKQPPKSRPDTDSRSD